MKETRISPLETFFGLILTGCHFGIIDSLKS